MLYAQQGGFFIHDAPGGTGKTVSTSLMLAEIPAQGHFALKIVSSGNVATILQGK